MYYKDFAEEYGYCSTSINTRINTNYRISSIYRKFSNPNFEAWGWETLLWNDDNIEKQYNVLYGLESVVELHTKVSNQMINERL
ncbi:MULTISPECIES: hypothetical protein [Lysinibacillus]|uniref:hypothetical protein n=1 Tax=Lysinibacillus TaxID=400634 RepID=UPI00214C8328|nr:MULTISPECIES: hypothetical protein [Lysinibacillus]UUV25940.1 hypothetical protein NP781_04790 [Lysinibacillus sp. FN11]UYB48813.1 hypothetical protein OCI51_07580 [Lysinibacillus capsici]